MSRHVRRLAESEVEEAIADTPVVLIHGPRQSGKSTLAKVFSNEERRYLSFDNPRYLEDASKDPLEFLNTHSGPLILDEVQRVPKLFLPLKLKVDEDRMPGRYILTGSANVLALPKVADSLAGRMAIIDLLPFSQNELEGADSNFVENLFTRKVPKSAPPTEEAGVFRRLVVGGFPEANARATPRSRERWFEDYLRTIIERDVREIANIDALNQMPRVLRLIASRSGSTLNVASLSRDVGIPITSLHRYLELFTAVFMTIPVPPWSNNRGLRVTKSSKIFLVDSGLLCHLENITESGLERNRDHLGSVLESFVAMELRKLARFSVVKPDLYHLRTVKNLEVDFVLEAKGGDVVGVEVKSSRSITRSDVDGLRFLSELAGPKFVCGVILYCGDTVEPLATNIWAVPISALWT
jgi:predicted AAA+ superfamily ATPase